MHTLTLPELTHLTWGGEQTPSIKVEHYLETWKSGGEVHTHVQCDLERYACIMGVAGELSDIVDEAAINNMTKIAPYLFERDPRRGRKYETPKDMPVAFLFDPLHKGYPRCPFCSRDYWFFW